MLCRDNDMYSELPLVEHVGKLPARAVERPAVAEPENPVRSYLAGGSTRALHAANADVSGFAGV